MQYNFKGQYDAAQSYTVSDVVSYTISGTTRYYFCISPNSNTSPQYPQSTDSSYWGIINALSNFPNSVDSFIYRTNITGNDKVDISRINELMTKTSLTTDEQTELNNLIVKQRNKLFLADDMNAIQDSLSNLQMFFKDKVESKLNDNVNTINSTKDSALTAIEQKKNNVIEYMDSTTAGAIRNDMGIMGDLTTTDKSSLVNAVNEVNGKVGDASTTQKGIVMLDDSTSSASTIKAATPNSVKTVNDSLTTHKSDYISHTGYAVAAGTANAYTATLSPTLSAYAEGVSLRLKINVDNTGASTVDVNGLGAKSIKKSDGTDIASGKLKTGSVYTIVYNGTNFILQGEGGDLSDADKSNFISNVNSILGM